MKALLTMLSLSVLTLAACSKNEESPAQAPSVDQAITESNSPDQEPLEAAAPEEEMSAQEDDAEKDDSEAEEQTTTSETRPQE
ncbi:MAG: hypothetical protein R3194_04995 [Limnobacter sp.]|nr:hypothetical protein [Limnobacter sp.]